MQVIGFSLMKMHAERSVEFKKTGINNNIEFINVEKEEVNLLKDSEALKVTFKYSLVYGDQKKSEEKQAEIFFEGILLLSATKDEAKDFHKSWKNKEIPKNALPPLYNFIIRKCSVKALGIQEDLDLPSPYFKVPLVKVKE